ncbi:cytochrome c [Thalassospira lucentensis]|uniref:cytochrome c n=1 Tax=Thalassospira lucentensis TaxID=168935 RepID=UPI00142DA5A1|nr:cytochrome c [Thalassospira lucentensis]NIZ03118.1 c-type cytochrome [Thalassospira lucentensis]
MKKLIKIVAALAVLGAVAIGAIIFMPFSRTEPLTELPAYYKVPEGHGKYVMRMADCKACHTADGGEPFAGGRPIESPLGTIWSTNITPDPENGIGNYSLDDFRAALYDGVEPDGTHVYPAMPYENYRKMSEEDVRALYDFFMNEVKPVAKKAPETDLAFPFNQRWGLRLWNWFALGDAGHEDFYDDAVLNRGAYLVDSLGHCAACHSPRNAIMAQDGINADDSNYLAGGVIDGWLAPSLHGENSAPAKWSEQDLHDYLTTGRNSHNAVAGEMSQVVGDSLQYATDEDMTAMVTYLRHINGKSPSDTVAVANDKDEDANAAQDETTKLLASADPSMPLGPRLYLDNCNACHFVNGKGADGVFPEIDGNSLVTADTPNGLIDVILNGAVLPSTEKRPARLAMPDFGHRLSDEEVAELATFVRQGWSNDAPAVTADQVAAIRAKTH